MDAFEVARMPFVKDLHIGFLEEAYFLLRKIVLNKGKKKPFIRVILSDRTGYLPGVYFGTEKELSTLQSSLKMGDIVKIAGTVEDFQGVRQIKILKIEKSQKEIDEVTRFARRTHFNRRELLREVRERTEKISDKKIKLVCEHFLEDRNFVRLFVEAPASRFSHYAYIGGLLEHTLRVMQLVDSFARIYPHANRDLLLAGAFLHNVGKVDEYKTLLYDIDYSSQGRLKGHALLGYDRVRPVILSIGLDEVMALKLEHILVSHQGRKEWGAIEEPRFLEAFLVHKADAIDAGQYLFSEPRRSASDSPWSSWNPYLKTEIYLE